MEEERTKGQKGMWGGREGGVGGGVQKGREGVRGERKGPVRDGRSVWGRREGDGEHRDPRRREERKREEVTEKERDVLGKEENTHGNFPRALMERVKGTSSLTTAGDLTPLSSYPGPNPRPCDLNTRCLKGRVDVLDGERRGTRRPVSTGRGSHKSGRPDDGGGLRRRLRDTGTRDPGIRDTGTELIG